MLMKRMMYRFDRAYKERAMDVIGNDYCVGTFPSPTISSFKREGQRYELARSVKFEICNERSFISKRQKSDGGSLIWQEKCQNRFLFQ